VHKLKTREIAELIFLHFQQPCTQQRICTKPKLRKHIKRTTARFYGGFCVQIAGVAKNGL
jgi:hypothetical protein